MADALHAVDAVEPRVLMVSARAFPDLGGIESHVDTLAPLIAQAGYRVTIAASDPTGSLPARDIRHGVPIVRFRAYPAKRDYYFSPRLFRHIARGDYDLVHVHGINNAVPPTAMLAAIVSRTPFLVTFHSGGATTSLRARLRKAQFTLLALLFRRADALIAVSEFERQYFTPFLKRGAPAMAVIRNGGLQRAADLQVQPVPGLILSIGRLERYKGHHRAIAALPEILRTRPEARLRILGTGTYRAELRALAEQLGVDKHVEIDAIPPQERDAMAREIARADVVVLLSDYEAHPIAVMEGLAFGRPVIVRRNSGMTELADEGWVTGVSSDATDSEVAGAILDRFGSTPSVQPADLPSWSACATAVAQTYDLVLAPRRRPAAPAS